MNKNEKIERLRKKLHKAIDTHGTESEKVQKLSEKMDYLVAQQYRHEVEYPENSTIKNNYYKCMEILRVTYKETGYFVTVKKWNEYAYKNGLLSNVSIEYISRMNWRELSKYMK